MKSFFKYMLASTAGFVLASIIGFFIITAIITSMIMASLKAPEVRIKEGSILKIELASPIQERRSESPFDNIDFFTGEMKQSYVLRDVVTSIKNAAEDDKIKGIYLDLGFVPSGVATLDEVREALLTFKESGKFIYAYSDSYAHNSYYLASVADSVFTNPEAIFWFAGFNMESMFMRGAFDKLDIEPKILRAGEYKSAGEGFERYQMSDENRLQLTALLESYYTDFLEKISTSRSVEVSTLRQIANDLDARYPEMAITHGLIDVANYRDEFLGFLAEKAGFDDSEDIEFTGLSRYIRYYKAKDQTQSKNRIALVYATGAIGMGEGDAEQIGAKGTSDAIREARNDENVKAIVLRVNSPGGSALASDIIWREVEKAREEKPVVVSMGPIAASGGYYIAASADKIYAQPNTITGSIGVIAMLLNTENFWKNKTGIQFDRVKTGQHADLGNPNRPMSVQEEKIIQEFIDKTYDDFLNRVADGRGMDYDFVDSVGRGRVWTGLQAFELGLVDAIGGLEKAIAEAASMAEIDEYRIMELPRLKSPFEKILKDFQVSSTKEYLQTELGIDYSMLEQIRFAEENRDRPLMWMPYHFRIE